MPKGSRTAGRYHLTYTLTGPCARRTKPDFYWNDENDWKRRSPSCTSRSGPAARNKGRLLSGSRPCRPRAVTGRRPRRSRPSTHGLTDGGRDDLLLYPASSIARDAHDPAQGSLLTSAHVTPVLIGAAALALLARTRRVRRGPFGRRDRPICRDSTRCAGFPGAPPGSRTPAVRAAFPCSSTRPMSHRPRRHAPRPRCGSASHRRGARWNSPRRASSPSVPIRPRMVRRASAKARHSSGQP